MRIVYICNEYPPAPHGGIGTFTHTIAQTMVAAGHDITVVGFGLSSGVRNDNGVKVVTLPECRLRGIAWLINRLRLHFWLRERVKTGMLDIIETPEFIGLLPFPFKHCPVIVRLHLSMTAINRQAGLPIKSTIKWCERHTLKNHLHWIGVSRCILEQTEKLTSLKPHLSEVIYNPVTLETNIGVSPTDLPEHFVLFVGSVSKRKGADILAEACQKLLFERENLHLVYIGTIVIENGLRADERIVSILGETLTNRVHFLGRLSHAATLACMRKAIVLAFPSRLEAFALVPLEAMACGTPVVYTTIPPGPEVVEDGITGLLADPYSATDIAAKITLILDNPAFAKELVNNAERVLKKRFSVENCIKETLEFYTECITCNNKDKESANK